jgi:hypothetical protein
MKFKLFRLGKLSYSLGFESGAQRYICIRLSYCFLSYFISLASIANQMILCGALVDGKRLPFWCSLESVSMHSFVEQMWLKLALQLLSLQHPLAWIKGPQLWWYHLFTWFPGGNPLHMDLKGLQLWWYQLFTLVFWRSLECTSWWCCCRQVKQTASMPQGQAPEFCKTLLDL